MKKTVITKTIKHGQVIRTPHITIHWLSLPGQETKQPKPTIIISKKVSSSAVVRHKYQRWIKEYIRSIPNLPLANYVLIAKPSIRQVTSLNQLIDSLEPKLNTLLGKTTDK